MSESSVPPLQSPIGYAVPVVSEDASHLKALAICHWVLGGLTVVVGFFPIIHITLGVAMLNGAIPPPQSNPNAPPFPADLFAWMFIVMGSIAMLMMWTVGVLIISSGACIHRRRKRMFSVVIAAITCAGFPLGTVLGVFTLMVLFRESVKRMYVETPAR